MIIVTWNCNGALRRKKHLLERFHADLLVIQECEDPSRSTDDYRSWAGRYLWTGNDKNKGLGVFAKSNISIEALPWESKRLQLFLPVRVDSSINVLAVWTKQAGSKHFGYIGQFWKYLQIHKDKLSQPRTIICGDLNSNAIWHDEECWWNHLDVVRELEEIGIHSLYHKFFSEQQGKESRPTLFMRRKIYNPYHIDYVFAHGILLDKGATMEVEKPEDWLQHSDHMPLTVTFISDRST